MNKLKAFINWLITKNLGRYMLGASLLLIGGLIARFLDEQIGSYIYYPGAVLLVIQTLFMIVYSIVYNAKRKN